jgi:hypothetical protein
MSDSCVFRDGRRERSFVYFYMPSLFVYRQTSAWLQGALEFTILLRYGRWDGKEYLIQSKSIEDHITICQLLVQPHGSLNKVLLLRKDGLIPQLRLYR